MNRRQPVNPLSHLCDAIVGLGGHYLLPQEVAAAFGDGKLQRHEQGLVLLDRVHKGVAGLERGAVFPLNESAIGDYPHLPRVFDLEAGLDRHVFGPFAVEEKVDGYNVRVARIGSQVVALSRGGYLCPFTTDRLVDFPGVVQLVEEGPDLVACAEMAGPGSPYNREGYHGIKDIDLRVFDLMHRRTGKLLPPDDRDAVLAGRPIPTPARFGVYYPDEIARMRDLVRQVDGAGQEGIVVKPLTEAGGSPLKYVTPTSTRGDLHHTFPLLGDHQETYYLGRILRIAFHHYEFDKEVDAGMAEALGRAILEPLLQGMERVREQGFIDEEYRIRMHDEEELDRFLAHLGSSSAAIQILESERFRDADGYVVSRFVKRYQKASGFFGSRLGGTLFID